MKSSARLLARKSLTFLFVAAFIAGCNIGSYDDAVDRYNAGDDPTVPPPTTPPPPTTGFGPNFSEIQSNVFTPTCATSTCHSAATAAAGLVLDSTNSYAMLVGISSTQSAGTQRVLPLNPDNSYLIQKLEGPGATGSQMPPGGSLDAADIATIRAWITAGAVDDRATPPPSSPIRVSTLSIGPGSTITAAPTQIVASFDREPVAASVNATTFLLQTSAGVGITASSITISAANARNAIFGLSGVTLADGTYTVRLLGSGASIISDMDANALDGEYSGRFPSGNGVEGGDFSVQFTISTPVTIGPTLDQIQAAVFTPSCASSSCHSNGAQAAGLSLADADTSYLELVGQFSGQVVNQLVEPNNSAASYLIHKLEGAATIENARMPIGLPAIAQSDIDVIKQWIDAGALR